MKNIQILLVFLSCMYLFPQSVVAQCVGDITPPVAVCQNFTVVLRASSFATVLPMDIDGGSTDNCIIANMTINGSLCKNLHKTPTK